MCYIIYYETKYAKNEEDFLPMSILEIWETLVVLSRFVSVTKYWKRLDYILWHLQSRKSDNDDSSAGKVLLPCPWLDLTWNVRAPKIFAMVRLQSIGFLLQVGRCHMEDHRAWQERLSTHVCWSTFVSERRSSRVTWMYYLCYVIGRSAMVPSSGKRRLCGKPWYFLMRRWNAIIPPTLRYWRIIKDMGQYTWQIWKAVQQFMFWSVCDAWIRQG